MTSLTEAIFVSFSDHYCTKEAGGLVTKLCQKSLPHNPLDSPFQNKCSIMLPPFSSYQEMHVVTEKCLAVKVSNLLFLFQELETGSSPCVFTKAPRCVCVIF